MSRWQQRVEKLLYDGETVEEGFDFATSCIVVTSHRVLAFTPEMDGQNLKQVDRPNVTGVGTATQAKWALLERSLGIGVVGGILVAAGIFLDFEGIVGDADPATGADGGQLGLGGVLETVQQLFSILARLDDFMRLFGSLALLLAVSLFGIYWHIREQTLVIETAGDTADIHVPRPADTADARSRLQAAIFPDRASIPDESGSVRDQL